MKPLWREPTDWEIACEVREGAKNMLDWCFSQQRWHLSWRADQGAREIADRHYNRQAVGSDQFVPPGRCVVLRCDGAVWVTSWPFAEFTKHEWAGAWVNSCFRKEGTGLASEMIREAVAATRAIWEPPELGMVTFVDPSKVRHKRDPGRCYIKAGFRHVGETKGGLLAFQMLPAEMPPPDPPLGHTPELFARSARPVEGGEGER